MNKEITVDSAKKLKAEIEKEFARAITEFEAKSGMKVTDARLVTGYDATHAFEITAQI